MNFVVFIPQFILCITHYLFCPITCKGVLYNIDIFNSFIYIKPPAHCFFLSFKLNNLILYIEAYLKNEFARRFGRAEENAFINGSGTDEPTGILNGGEIGVTTKKDANLSYDDVIRLYFSLKPEHRGNAVWLMNDETAFHLRTLKDENGNYLWNNNDNTILGKPVYFLNHMSNIESGKMPIAFGDFSYYWIVQRQPLTIKILKELFVINNEIGFTGYERLDGKLILPEAVKLIKMA